MMTLKTLLGKRKGHPIGSDGIRASITEGNNLKIEFTKDAYVLKGESLTFNLPLAPTVLEPGQVYPRKGHD